MHDAAWTTSIALLFGMAVAVAWVFRFLKAPSIIGFLITGIVIGPSSLGLIDAHSVEQFAETGLVLLLFTIGLELSPGPLLQSGARLLAATGLQIGITTALATLALALAGGLAPLPAALVGLGVALSSTAIVLKTLSDRREVQTTMGNISTGVLLLQDVTVIVVMLLLPLLAGGTPAGDAGHGGGGLASAAMGFVVMAAAIVAAHFALPYVLDQLTRRGGTEMTALFAVTMAAGGAWLAGAMGWPLPLGACVAGLLLAQADLRHQLAAEIAPFRDVFNAVFFVSLGMLVDVDLVVRHAPLLAGAIAITLALKTLVTAGAVLAAGWPLRVAIQVGIGLCTVSEFAYVLAHEAAGAGLISAASLQLLIPYAVGTMLLGAVFIPMSGPLAARLALGRSPRAETPPAAAGGHGHAGGDFALDGHVVIVGYGINGENLVSVLRATRIPFCVVEMNRALVQQARAHNAPTIVGDATRASILRSAGIETARAIVVAINDPEATRRIVAQARSLRTDLYVLARTYSVRELDALYERGADAVVPADFEVSIKIFAHVLTELRIPDNVIQAQIASVRAGGYSVLRGGAVDRQQNLNELLEVFRLTATQTYYVDQDSPANGTTIMDLHLRKHTGATIIAIVRSGAATTNPDPGFEMRFGDVLVLVGSHAQLDAARKLLDAGHHPPPAE